MRGRVLCLIAVLLCISSPAWAGPDNSTAVPEASAILLAPLGVAAIVAAERRRRGIVRIKHGVGALYHIVKRLVDLLLSTIVLLLTSPLFGIIALLVKRSSPGPVVFKRRVIGMYGKSFDMYKFRSMVENAEAILANDKGLQEKYYEKAKLDDDPRVTSIGNLLRRTSLDELPQLINIFLGHMTFVGPRPIASDELPMYGESFDKFATVKPGITGIWQTCGRSETSYSKRVEMDMLYIDNRSILLDLWIIVTTVPAVVLKRGAV